MSYKFGFTSQPTYLAARVIAPTVCNLIGVPKRVVDLGGGAGGFLKAFEECGASEVLNYDSPRISDSELLIEPGKLRRVDLSKAMPPVCTSDLAISTEFAEHVGFDMGREVVRFLTDSAPVVLFSAAFPGQGGAGHVNEQYPRYWRDLFAEMGYQRRDVLRGSLLSDQRVPIWLRQNLFLFVRRSALDAFPVMKSTPDFIPEGFDLVSSSILEQPIAFSTALKGLFAAVRRRASR